MTGASASSAYGSGGSSKCRCCTAFAAAVPIDPPVVSGETAASSGPATSLGLVLLALRLQEGLLDQGDENQRERHNAQGIGIGDALIGADPGGNRLIDREQVESQREREAQAIRGLAPDSKEEKAGHRVSHGNGATEEVD